MTSKLRIKYSRIRADQAPPQGSRLVGIPLFVGCARGLNSVICTYKSVRSRSLRWENRPEASQVSQTNRHDLHKGDAFTNIRAMIGLFNGVDRSG
jgi:hypothetical protein